MPREPRRRSPAGPSSAGSLRWSRKPRRARWRGRNPVWLRSRCLRGGRAEQLSVAVVHKRLVWAAGLVAQAGARRRARGAALTPGTIGRVMFAGHAGPGCDRHFGGGAFRLRLAERPDRLRAVGRRDRDPDARACAVGVSLEVQRDRQRNGLQAGIGCTSDARKVGMGWSGVGASSNMLFDVVASLRSLARIQPSWTKVWFPVGAHLADGRLEIDVGGGRLHPDVDGASTDCGRVAAERC